MYGEHVWDEVMDAGEAHGIRPFGLEAQRILRLEKQHILVGQDTDAESDPFEAGLGWMVKADKDDFLGKRALEDLDAEAPAERLVGFTRPGTWVPPEGACVVHDGVWVGRVTSARRSAAAGAIVGLAWVPAGWASDGTAFEIQFGGSTARARPSRRGRSTTPRARGCGREDADPPLAARAIARGPRARVLGPGGAAWEVVGVLRRRGGRTHDPARRRRRSPT